MITSKQSTGSDDIGSGKNGSTTDDVDLQTLRDDVARLTQQLANLVVATGEDAFDEMKGQMHRAKDAVRETTDPIIKGVEEALYKHPVMTLALAVGVGLAFGAAWRR